MHLRRVAYAVVLICGIVGAGRAQEVRLKIIAINDLHGNLQSTGTMRADANSPMVPVGGVDLLAGHIAHLKSENPNNVVVSAGDLTGGSPLISALFDDEDTIEVANRFGLEMEAVGNHEFDKGMRELRRFARGGCSTVDTTTCKGKAAGTPVPFEGAKFQYLAANVFDEKTGKTIFPAYMVKTYQGVKVGFIGLTLKDTPTIVVEKNIVGLRFSDEAETINKAARELRGKGVSAVVVLIHQGGRQTDGWVDINGCAGGMNGTPIQSIAGKLDDSVDLVISAHTHQPYVCQLPNNAGRKILVTSASSYGRVVSDIDMTIDPQSKHVTGLSVHNLLVDRTNTAIQPDAKIAHIEEAYAKLAAPLVDRVVGSVMQDIPKEEDANGESPMGGVLADSLVEATQAKAAGGAVAAFMNSGGIRDKLQKGDGKVTYGELYGIQPFGNTLVTMTLTGAQIKMLLEEQFKGCAVGGGPDDPLPITRRVLQVSDSVRYTWSESAAACAKVDAASLKIGGVVVDPAAKYRVTVNNFLAEGGEEFPVLKLGTDRRFGPSDLEALTAYFAKHAAVFPPKQQRITKTP
jgi:5'-nucleotidase